MMPFFLKKVYFCNKKVPYEKVVPILLADV